MQQTFGLPEHQATRERHMSAVVITAPREIEIRQLPAPPPGPGDVLVRLEGCGVCASSLPVWEGRDWFEYPQEPGAPGHEGWGRIELRGAGVHTLEVGQRVAMISNRAFATHELVPADHCVPLPAGLDEQPFPGEPLACAMNIFRRSRIEAGQTIAVIGAGFLGNLLIQLAKSAGARVVGVSRRTSSLEQALDAGADFAFGMEDDGQNITAEIEDLTEGAGCEVVIEAAGKQATLDLGGRLTAVRGRLVVAGYHQDGERCVDMQDWNWKGIDVINAHERDPAIYVDGMRLALDAVAEGRMDYRPLLTHEFPLDQAAGALELLARRPEGFVKAWIRID